MEQAVGRTRWEEVRLPKLPSPKLVSPAWGWDYGHPCTIHLEAADANQSCQAAHPERKRGADVRLRQVYHTAPTKQLLAGFLP